MNKDTQYNDDIPLNIVNTQIDWHAPIVLQNGLKLTVSEYDMTHVNLIGTGFSCVVIKATGLPTVDVFNWDFFPVKNSD
jgi:hypothetical protein